VLGCVIVIVGNTLSTTKLYVALSVLSPSLNSISQLHPSLSIHNASIVNVFPFNVHVAFIHVTTVASILSQLHASAPKSTTTFSTTFVPVITHNSILSPLNVKSTSVHVIVTVLLSVSFSKISFNCTATLYVHTIPLYTSCSIAVPYTHAQLYAFVGNHTHVSAAALIVNTHVLHSATSTSLISYVGAVQSILFTTWLPAYVSFPFASTALKHTYVPLSLSALNTISLPSVYEFVAVSHVALVHVL
jgi:hypothetical protein